MKQMLAEAPLENDKHHTARVSISELVDFVDNLPPLHDCKATLVADRDKGFRLVVQTRSQQVHVYENNTSKPTVFQSLDDAIEELWDTPELRRKIRTDLTQSH
ncbi:MAG: hypothetical protein JNM52_00945 [Betaproteobacteria bacterium]|nr:hypothetical protein [Betaproteobacteria bacterium]